MRNVKTIFLIIMVIGMFILTGCDVEEYIDDTKDEIEYYYDNYNDEDFDDIIDTVHPALLDIMSEELRQFLYSQNVLLRQSR